MPPADVTDLTPINMSGSAGKVALVTSTTGLGCNGGSTPCSPAQLALIVDLVGYGSANFYEGGGPAPTLTNSTAGFRANSGCVDTDNNNSDFSAATPAPRNTASPLHSCADAAPIVESTYPADGATDFPVNADLQVNFTEFVNTIGSWFDLSCSQSGAGIAASVSGGPQDFMLNPAVTLVDGETCTLTIYAAGITDQDWIDPPDNMRLTLWSASRHMMFVRIPIHRPMIFKVMDFALPLQELLPPKVLWWVILKALQAFRFLHPGSDW